ncbi:MAG: lauroyl acyltransferase [Fibrobacter sp.]|uniref:LpxL/LpxP family acyltransferase n=1 Tax=Fibrobacter sp. UWB5 TaxID=1964360 RepID=UPI000B51F5C0|nr:lauroyl acyltransferase [Fibrobacter sp. UWB5]MBR4680648.1 lauroyl acyltransferase [Fibrobacter sp.]OWV11799.1 lauroyl acyltransferase [Fibrobacter sp. UWB5]
MTKSKTYKILLNVLLRVPDVFYSALFAVAFPIYKALHTKRAYGRTVRHLENAKAYLKTTVSARDMFKGIFWNALDSYRGLARFKSVESRIVYENEEIIREAVKLGPVAGISIHQGAFELLHRALCRYSEHVHLITDSVGNDAFREVLKELRSDPHLTEYHPEETGKLIRDLFKTKGILAMVFDQGKNTKGNEVQLFGQASTLYLRLPQKVNQMGASVVTFRTWTNTRRQIVIRFESAYPPKTEPEMFVKDIAKETETWISEHPEQWSWNYHGNFRV